MMVKWTHPENLRQWQNSIDSCPVLTLDAIEAWLVRERLCRGLLVEATNAEAAWRQLELDGLLAQVQAWKENK